MKNHNAYVAGIPDVWYSGDADDLWIEYKFIKTTAPRSNVVPNLSKQQMHWIIERREEGRNVWVIVGCPKGGVIYRSLGSMQRGLTPDNFQARLESRKDLATKILNHCKRPTNATKEHPPELRESG